MSFQAALDLAIAQNPEVAAVRRGRAVRDAEVRRQGSGPTPSSRRRSPATCRTAISRIGYPLDLAGHALEAGALVATREAAMADIDEKAALSSLRRDLRLAFYGLVAADEQLGAGRRRAEDGRARP